MGRDNHPKNKQLRNITRREANRAPYDRILIVSEGSKTEPLYFKEIRSTYRLRSTNIQVHPSEFGTDPKQVVRYAEDLFKNRNPHKRIAKMAFEQVYVVFDRDEHRTYFDALSLIETLDEKKMRNDTKRPVVFYAITSIPCFELWLLLHFKDVQHLMHRNEVLRQLKHYLPDYEKGMESSFARTKQNLGTAQRRARDLCQQSNPFDETKPYTAVGELVAMLATLKT